MEEILEIKGLLILPGRCPRWWMLEERYQNQPDELYQALAAHMGVCACCRDWFETVCNSGGAAPYPDNL